jgi:hypothetical protein
VPDGGERRHDAGGPARPGLTGTEGRFRHPAGGHSPIVSRIKLVYWALIGVLGALTFFLLAAGARVLLGGREGC